MLTPPVLFLVFNRPDTTAKVFDAVRTARPKRLYVAADGPRDNRPGEVERCNDTRRIATLVDWPCEVRTLFRDRNIGCGRAVYEAISWFFRHEPEGIILEDDLLPDPTFFDYCAELLERYRYDDRIMAVCGGSYSTADRFGASSYTFARTFDPWGWASWRRAWEKHDPTMPGLREFKGRLRSVGPSGFDCRSYWLRMFEKTRDGLFDTWDFPWTYSIFRAGGLVAYPSTNLISNLGFRDDATHTLPRIDAERSWNAEMQTFPLGLPVLHPQYVRYNLDFEVDLYTRRLELTRLSSVGVLNLAVRRRIAAVRARISPHVPAPVKARIRAWRAGV